MNIATLPESFFVDLAIGVRPLADICEAIGVDPADVEQSENDPQFRRRFAQAQQAVTDDGSAFRARCRTIVNESITEMERLMRDPDTPPSVQLEAFKTLVKFGEMEKPPAAASQAGGLQLVIVAPSGESAPTLTVVQPPALPAPTPADE